MAVGVGGGGGGGIPSDYFVSTQLQLWLFCCWGFGCCWAVTKKTEPERASFKIDVAKVVCDWCQSSLSNIWKHKKLWSKKPKSLRVIESATTFLDGFTRFLDHHVATGTARLSVGKACTITSY